MPETALTPAIRDQIAALGKADIMVGIPSFKNAATIGYVVRAAQAGLVQYFPDLHPVVVNSRRRLARRHRSRRRRDRAAGLRRADPPRPAQPQAGAGQPDLPRDRWRRRQGRGAADDLRDRRRPRGRRRSSSSTPTCARIVPEWIELLAGPILKGGYDFVAPLYARYKYDGTITNTVTYPLTRALYGHRIRQPIGGDFGVSGDLVRHYLTLDDWTDDVSKFGIDIWMTTSALAGGFAVCQTRLGAKIHDPKDPGADLGPMFRQVVGTILRLADRYDDHWLPIRGSHDVPAYGFERIIDPPPLEVNTLRLLSEFHAGSLTLADTWRSMLAPATVDTVLELAAEAGRLGDQARAKLGIGGDVASTSATTLEMAEAVSAFHFPDDLWARVIYDLVVTARDPKPSLETLVASLVPDLLRAGRLVRHREPPPDDRPGRGPRRAPGPRVRAAQALPRRALERRGARRVSPKSPLPARILIPVANPGTAEELIRLGAAMLDPRAGELSALGIVEVPEGMPLSEGATRARHARRLLQKVLDYAPDGHDDPPHRAHRPACRRGHHRGVRRAGGRPHHLRLGRQGAGRHATAATARPSSPRPSTRSCASRRPTSPSSSSAAPATSSASSSRSAAAPMPSWRCASPTPSPTHHDATVVVLHLVPPGITMAVRAQAERALAAFVKQHLKGRGEGVLREAPNVRNAILREAEKADLVVMGASASPGGDGTDTYLFGALPEAIAARAKASVVVVKTREAIGRPTFEALASRAETLAAADRAAEEARAVPARVERWFGESNFHHAEFADLRRLVQLKEKQGVTVSLVLPTLDEEETIGPIVRRAMREMVGRVPLLDEVLVIDSASTDRTREIAEAEGARVVQHPDVLTRYGSFRGKGEALWKSLFETTGDIVVWADTDVQQLAPPDGLRHARAAPPRAAPAVRQGLLPAPHRRGRRCSRKAAAAGSRSSSRGRSSTCSTRSCPGSSSRWRASTPVAARCSRRSRSSPATRSRSATSSTPPSGSASRASARSTWSAGSTATRSSRACRGCRSSSSRRS